MFCVCSLYFLEGLVDYLQPAFNASLLVDEPSSSFGVRNTFPPWSWEFICSFHLKPPAMWSRLFDSAGWHTCFFFKQLLSLFFWQQMPLLSNKVELTPTGKLKESDMPLQILAQAVGKAFSSCLAGHVLSPWTHCSEAVTKYRRQ